MINMIRKPCCVVIVGLFISVVAYSAVVYVENYIDNKIASQVNNIVAEEILK